MSPANLALQLKGGRSKFDASLARLLMTPHHNQLWRRIEAFEIDEGRPEITFAARLAKENGWSPEYAAKAIAEYKRFLLLAVAAGHPVTPSKNIDLVWHLHLSYTRSYWDRLCKQVLRQPLHHDPSTGGAFEEQKFRDWYRSTLESYERIFGSPPPVAIWPRKTSRRTKATNSVAGCGAACGAGTILAAGSDAPPLGDGGASCGASCGGGGCGGGCGS